MTTPAEGSVHRGLVMDGMVRFLAVEARAISDHVRANHHLGPDAARLAAECVVASLFMSAYIKGEERLTLQLQADDPAFAFLGDVDSDGGTRARLTPSRVHAPGGIHGLMYAIKSDTRRELYRGITALDGQTVQDALSSHLLESSQVSVLLRLEAQVDDEGRVSRAGGLLLEKLPGADDGEAFERAFGAIRHQPVADLLVELAFGHIAGRPVELLENRRVHWRCSCGTDRIESVLLQLGADEMQSLLDDEGKAEVTCNFCNLTRTIGPDRLRELIAHAEPKGEA